MAYGICSSALRAAGAGAAALIALLGATAAQAQPDPFEDYEEGASAVDLDEPEALPQEGELGDEEPTEVPPEAGPFGDYGAEQFLWTAGLGTQFSYSGTSNEVLTGETESNRTMFLTLAPRVGFFPIENFELGLALGLLSQLAARERGDTVAQNHFFFEASAHYHLVLGSAFAIVPGLGLGGYFGSSARTLQLADGSSLDESTASNGFLLHGYLGVGYQPSPVWRLRSGISVGGLVGSEKVDSQDANLASSGIHVGLPLEISYLFH